MSTLKTSNIIHHDSISVVDSMTDKVAGRFIKALAELMVNEPTFSIDTINDPLIKIALYPFIQQFKRDSEKWHKVAERNRVNGAKGGRPNKPTGLSGNPNKPRKAVSGSVNGSVNEVKKKTPSLSGEVEEKKYITKNKKILSGKELENFLLFWNAFGYKSGKAEAADVWFRLKPDSNLDLIIKMAKKEANVRSGLVAQGRTPKMAQGWLSGRRWEDEPNEKEKLRW